MAVYSSGSVKLRVGYAEVVGNNTSFQTYVTAGDLFKVTGEATWYTVGAVNSATNLDLSSAYVNSNFAASTVLSGQPYQVVRDFTTNYKIPEAAPTDKNMAYIYTRGMRTLDDKVYNASQNSASINNLIIKQSVKQKSVSKAVSYTATNINHWIVFTGNAASVNATLFPANAKNKAKDIFITNNSIYTVRVRAKGADNINASTVIKLKSRYKTFHGYIATPGLWIRLQ